MADARHSMRLAEALDAARNLVAALEEAQVPIERFSEPDPKNVAIAEAYVKARRENASAELARATAAAFASSQGAREFDVDATVEHLKAVAESISGGHQVSGGA